jgi:hypothetical protein
MLWVLLLHLQFIFEFIQRNIFFIWFDPSLILINIPFLYAIRHILNLYLFTYLFLFNIDSINDDWSCITKACFLWMSIAIIVRLSIGMLDEWKRWFFLEEFNVFFEDLIGNKVSCCFWIVFCVKFILYLKDLFSLLDKFQ